MDWNRIRMHYAKHMTALLAVGSRWAIDPYAWDHECGIRLTPIEWALWSDIRAEGAVFYPQFPIGKYFADFANPCAKVAIECDGRKWHTDPGRDAWRQACIEDQGWTVYRIGGRECLTEFQEQEDEYGRVRIVVPESRSFIREICAKHPVRHA